MRPFSFLSSKKTHTAVDGRPVPGTFADATELLALGHAVRQASPGADAVFQAITAGSMGGDEAWDREIELLAKVSLESGLTATFTFGQGATDPDQWRGLLERIGRHNRSGARLVPQISGRPLGILVGLRIRHAWYGRPHYEEIAHLPVEEPARRMALTARGPRVEGTHPR